MKKRIYGLETEYGIALVGKDGSWHCDFTELTPYIDFLRDSRASSYASQFLPNGSRLYREGAFHPEYCTAECVDLADLIAQDKAGEKILDWIFARAIEETGIHKRVALFKNNVQYAPEGALDPRFPNVPHTFGCHENFSAGIEINENTLGLVLIPFLVARQIVSGSGWVANDHYQDRGFRYAISQRTRCITRNIGDSTNSGGSRAILCTARHNKPLADERKYQRLHLILGDSNMSEISTYLKMGTIGILLEMIEEGYTRVESVQRKLAQFFPVRPVEALQLVCFDLTCRKPVIELSDGKLISAIDMLWEYVDMMDKYESVQGLSPELSDVLARLKDGLARLERREIDPETLMEVDSQGLDEEWDWLIKKSILDYTLQSFGCHWNNFSEKQIDFANGRIGLYEKLIANDLKYHDISPGGLYNEYTAEPNLPPSRLRELGIKTPRLVDRESIRYMEQNPPQNTRAKVRGDFIRFLLDEGISPSDFHINWDFITPPSRHRPSEEYQFPSAITLRDPFAAENEQLRALMSTIRQQGASS